MRRFCAAVVDVSLAGVLAFIGFRVADWAAPCPDQGECVILTPLIVASVLLAVSLYFGVGQLLFGSTFGERALQVFEHTTDLPR